MTRTRVLRAGALVALVAAAVGLGYPWQLSALAVGLALWVGSEL